MAMYDNKYWLLSRIENAFITTDDTGFSEMIMSGQKLSEQIPEDTRYPFDEEKDTEDEERDRNNSYSECFDGELGFRRQRSNTAVRLEKMEKDKKENASIKVIEWSEPKPITDEDRDIMFPEKKIINKPSNKTSLLSEQIKNQRCQPKNPFKDYERFDGSVQVGVCVRKYDIFVKMLPSKHRDYPLPVSIISTAKISDLIGLILWKCSLQYPEYKPKDSVKFYELYIVEDDCEIDAFPCLDPRENVSKFIFRKLALIEKKTANFSSQNPNCQIKFKPPPPQFNMPSNKVESSYTEIDLLPDETPTAMDALLYKTYRIVQLCYGIANIKMEVDFGMTAEKIDIDPVVKHNSSFFSKRKPISYNPESIIACDLTKKKNGKATFRLIYDDHSESNQSKLDHFKWHDFETKQNTAEEIVRKVNHIISLHHCSRRIEYLRLREQKSHRRRSFHFGPR